MGFQKEYIVTNSIDSLAIVKSLAHIEPTVNLNPRMISQPLSISQQSPGPVRKTMVALQPTDLLLDSNIRNYVLVPIFVLTLCTSIIRSPSSLSGCLVLIFPVRS